MAHNKSQGPGSGTSNRGFASMDEQKQREIASKGGRSVAAQDRSFSQNRELAAQAGRKGGQASHGGRGAQRRGTAAASARKSEVASVIPPAPAGAKDSKAGSGARGANHGGTDVALPPDADEIQGIE